VRIWLGRNCPNIDGPLFTVTVCRVAGADLSKNAWLDCPAPAPNDPPSKFVYWYPAAPPINTLRITLPSGKLSVCPERLEVRDRGHFTAKILDRRQSFR
jgi:hypothetical protein